LRIAAWRVGQGQREQRRMFGDSGGTLGLCVAGECADFDLSALRRDAGKTADAVEVDQELRRRQPHVEGGDQALSAGEQSRLAVRPRQQLDGMLDRFRLGIGKGRRLHAKSSRGTFCFFLFWPVTAARAMRHATIPGCGP
jgi:hypothetical protein